MQTEDLLELARRIGFSYVGKVNMEALMPLAEIREMCRADRCSNYGKSWSCPPSPLCGDLEKNRMTIASYDAGILVQTTGQMTDAFDLSVIREAEKKQKKMFDTLVRQVRQMGISILPLSSGGCTRCYRCTYPDRPCRFGDRLYPSMEAYGLWVSDVCRQSGLDYKHGENTITYTACLLYRH